MRTSRKVAAALAVVAVPVVSAALFVATLEDRTAEGTQYLLSAMEAATQTQAQTGSLPSAPDELAIPAWEGLGHVSTLQSADSAAVCIQLTLPNAKLAIYSSDPKTVVDGPCSVRTLD